jgi:hypothetical protein
MARDTMDKAKENAETGITNANLQHDVPITSGHHVVLNR